MATEIVFQPLEFRVKHNLPARDLTKNIRRSLQDSLKKKYEGICFQGLYPGANGEPK